MDLNFLFLKIARQGILLGPIPSKVKTYSRFYFGPSDFYEIGTKSDVGNEGNKTWNIFRMDANRFFESWLEHKGKQVSEILIHSYIIW